MTSVQWESVLIDWVNCLKLCKPVHTLDELRNGEFFRHLRKLIKKSTSPIPDDDLTAIFNLLSQHYPGVKFSEKDSVHLKDMDPTDLVNLTSLLMHYTCIYDRRNALTSPMCYSLNLATQLYIKVFLELISNETTNNDLAGVIQDICSENHSTLADSPVLRHQSPLQTLLKTPATKNIKLIEKSREIERLKLELESEKADRNDCEFELAHFKDKVTELEGHLKQKNSEIKRLRLEVETLKMRTPPEFQDVPSRESHTLLQKEIENLEEYIQKCEQEQDTLQKDKDNLKERARKLENDCTMWQQNFYEIEEKYQSTVEQLREFELKNDTLEEHCSELQALLSEYQGVKNFDDSMEVRRNRRSKGFENAQLDEDLAHSVVDMQLKEAQKMIEDLTQEKTELVAKFQLECDSLRVQISSSTQQVSQQQDQLATLSHNLQLSNQQCDTLKHALEQVQEQLKHELLKVEEKDARIQQLQTEQDSLQQQELVSKQLISEQQKELATVSHSLKDSTQQCDSLKCQLEEALKDNRSLKEQLSKLTTDLEEKDCQLSQVQCEVLNYSTKLEESTVTIRQLQEQSDSLKKELELSRQLVKQQQEKMATLSQTLEESNSLSDSLKCQLKEALNDNQSLNDQLSKVIADLEEKSCQLSQVNQEVSNYTVKLCQLEQHLVTVDTDLKRQTEEVVRLQQLNTEKSIESDSLKKELELGRQLVKQQQEEMATLSQTLDKSNSLSNSLKCQLEEALNDKQSLKEQLSKLTTNLEEKGCQLSQVNQEMTNYITQLKESTVKTQKLEEQLVVVTTESDNLQKELELSRQLVKQQEEKMATVSHSLEKSQQLCDSLKCQLEEALNDNQSLNDQLSKIMTDLEEKGCQLSQVSQEVANYTTQLKESTVKIQKLEKQIVVVTTESNSLQKELELDRQLVKQQQEELATLSQTLDESNSLSDSLKCQLEEALNDNQSLKEQLSQLTTNLEEKDNQLNQVNQEVSNYTVKLCQLEQHLVTVDTDLKRHTEEVVRLQQLNTEKSIESDSLKKELELGRQLVEQQQSELATLSQNLDLSKLEAQTVRENLTELQGRFDVVSEQVSDLRTVKSECEQLRQLQQDLEVQKLAEIASKTTQITKLEVENDSLKQKEAVTRQMVDKQQEELAILSRNLEVSKLQLEEAQKEVSDLRTVKSEYESLRKLQDNSEILVNTLKLDIESLTAQITKLEADNDSLKQKQAVTRQMVDKQLEELAILSRNLEVSKLELEEAQKEVSDLRTVKSECESLRKLQQDSEVVVDTLKLDIESKTAKLLTLTAQITKLEADNDSFKQKEAVTRQLVDKQQQELATLSQNLELSKLQLEEAQTVKDADLRTVKSECEQLGQLQQVLKLENTRLSEIVESKTATLTELMKQNDSLKLLLTQQEELVGKLETDKRNLEAQLTIQCQEKETVAETLTKQLNQALQELEETKKSLNKTQDSLKSLKLEKESISFYLKDTSKQLDEMEAKLQETQIQLKKATKEKTKLESECRNKLEVLQTNLSTKESELEVAKSEKDQLEREKQLLLQTHNETLKELEVTKNQVDKSQKATKVVQNFLDLNTNELGKVSQEKEQLLEALEMSNKDKLDLEEEIKSYNLELEKLREELQLKDCELVEANLILQTDSKKLLQDKAEILENLQKVIKEKEELFLELGNISSQLESIKKENQAIISDYQDLQSEIRNLEESLQRTKHSHQELESKLEISQKEKKDLENNYTKLQQEKNEIYDYLQRSVEDKEQTTLERDRLQIECQELKRERDAIFERIQSITEKYQKLELALELSQTETAKVKKERMEILQSQTEIMKDTEQRIVRAHDVAVEEKRELNNRVEKAEKERDALRQAYASTMAANSKLNLENSTLKKLLDERNHDLGQTSGLKEAYEKLLDDNCRYTKEIEVLKQKRARDREEFLTLLRKEQEKGKKVDQVRAEYEDKLDKMKERMLKLYREEVQKEMEKVKSEQAEEVAYLQKANDDLRSELWEVEKRAKTLEKECNTLKHTDRQYSSNVKHMGTSSLRGRSNKVADRNIAASCNSLVSRPSYALSKEVVETLPKVRSTSHLNGRESLTKVNERKLSTLPHRLQPGDYVEETVTVSRRTSINSLGRNFEMEDEEDDMFNNKYLTDLKEGRCLLPGGRESNANRVSELAWRNSMVPPHLKSSYPAELQFVSPTRFNEEDIKTGNVMDDSQCKLLPGEKQRAPKKDFGTTSYKKPGPPTPSKNGGRPSLQGGDVLPLREQNLGRTSTTPKKGTPGRLRALFKGMRDGGAHQRENLENLTPRESRRFSLWNRK